MLYHFSCFPRNPGTNGGEQNRIEANTSQLETAENQGWRVVVNSSEHQTSNLGSGPPEHYSEPRTNMWAPHRQQN